MLDDGGRSRDRARCADPVRDRRAPGGTRAPLREPHRPAAGAGSRPGPTPPYGMPVVHVDDPGTGTDTVEPDLATLNARLGLLASLSGFAFALPAVAILKLGGAPSVLWVAVVVFAAAAAAGARLPWPGGR